MSLPLVTVITTSFNRAVMLPAAIESVLRQTFTDFEYLIVDDCSRDASVAVARRYETDPRVRVCVNRKNLGDYGNRNQAARLARGKYLKYVDSDDMAYPHCLETMVQHLEQFPEAAVALSTSGRAPWVYPVQLSPADAYRIYFQEGRLFSQAALDAMIRREALLAAGGFPEVFSGDTACWLRLARSWPVVLTVSGLVWWRVHAEQISEEMRKQSPRSTVIAAETIQLLLEALDHPACPLPVAERAFYRKGVICDFASLWMQHALRGQWACCRELRRGVPAMRMVDVTGAFRPRVRQLVPPMPQGVAPIHSSRRSGVSFQGSSLLVSDFRATDRISGSAPLVSVLIPAYNAEAHLAKAIESVRNQRFADWELIIVDDAGTDRTAEIAQSYADGNRIRYYRNEHNLGKWLNHNRCAELARGKYLKFLHADDLMYPHCLAIMSWMMEKSPRAVLGVSGLEYPFQVGMSLTPRVAWESDLSCIPRFLEPPAGLIINAQVFRLVRGFDPAREPSARELSLRVSTLGDVLLIPPGLYICRRSRVPFYYEHVYPEWKAAGYSWLIDLIDTDTCPIPAAEKMEVKMHLRGWLIMQIQYLLRHGRWRKAWKLICSHNIAIGDVLRRRFMRRHYSSEFCFAMSKADTLRPEMWPPSV